MRQFERQWHKIVGFAAGVTKHHSLVAGTLVHRVLAHNTAVNIRALFVNGRENTARIAVETVFSFCVTNAVDHFACNFLHIDVSFGFNFAGKHNLTGGNQSFARYFRVGVESKNFVQNCI